LEELPEAPRYSLLGLLEVMNSIDGWSINGVLQPGRPANGDAIDLGMFAQAEVQTPLILS
jgi:hypothetical protein